MKVLYVGPVGGHSGYGQAANDYCMALHQAEGIELAIDTQAGHTLDRRYAALDVCIDRGRDMEPDIVVIHGIPPVLTAVADGYDSLDVPLVAVTTWETHRMPWEIASDIEKRFAQIVVPSEFVKTTFAGYEKSVEVIPHCFDPSWWFREPDLTYDRSRYPYAFYSVLTEYEQKNMKGLLTAYLTEFTAKDEVFLTVHTPSWNKDEFTRLVQLVGKTDPPRVLFNTERTSDTAIRDLHQAGDCYVTLARGEGFGLGAFEASLSGNQVIATDWGGHGEHVLPGHFCQGELIPCQLTPAYVPAVASDKVEKVCGVNIRPVYRAGPMGVRADQLWAEPNLVTAREAMRRAYEMRRPKTTQYRGNLVEAFGYEAVGKKWVQALKKVLG